MNGDVGAHIRPGSWEVKICPDCTRGRSKRISSLSVELICNNAKVTETLGGPPLVALEIFESMKSGSFPEAEFHPVVSSWDGQTLWVGEPVPEFVELGAKLFVSASHYSVEFEDCPCGAVDQLHSNPLFVKNDESITARSVRKLVENPNILILGEETANYLKSFEPGLILDRVYYEDEYEEFQERTRSTMWEGLLDDV